MKQTTLFFLLLLVSCSAWSQRVWFQGVSKTNINVRGAVVNLAQVTVNAPVAGKVVVRFDGNCYSSAGDRIVLAASDMVDWSPNDGNVTTQTSGTLTLEPKPFSHTRIYNVTAGSHTFYAVAQNYVETGGDGTASIYGSLTAEYFPNGTNQPFANATGIIQTGVNLRGSAVTLGQITITAPSAGKVLLRFDGTCISSPGDRIVLAASNTADWGTNDGNVIAKAINASGTRNGFSHVRAYDVAAGTYTFYAVGQNYVDLGGSGTADIYGTLCGEFYPASSSSASGSEQAIVQTGIDVRTALVPVGQITLTVPSAGKVAVNFTGNCISTPGDLIVLASSDHAGWLANDGNIGVQALSASVDMTSFSHTRVYSVSPGTYTFYAVSQNFVYLSGTGVASIYGSLTTTFFADIVNRTEEQTSLEGIKMYPNPASDQFRIEFAQETGPVQVRLLNAQGQVLRSLAADHPADGLPMDLSAFPAGLYFVQLTTATGSAMKEVVRK